MSTPAMAPDVVVVGAGPAGLVAAIALSVAGAAVRIVDARLPPVDKACGEGLMPAGVAALGRIGVGLPARLGIPFRGIRFVDGARRAEGEFPSGRGLGVRRLELHAALAAAAADCGIEVGWGERLRGFRVEERGVRVETSRRSLTAAWLVGADGLGSRVRRLAGLDAGPGPRPRFGTRRHYRVAPWSDLVEVFWGRRVEAYVTPVGPELVGIAMLHGDPSRSFDDMLAGFPELARRVDGAPRASADRSAGPLHRRVHAVARGRIALVGDAAGYLDAISGEGLALAFHQAPALAAALQGGDVASYVRAHAEQSAAPLAVTRMLLLAERHPRLRRAALEVVARRPHILGDILGIMNGDQGARPSLVSRLAVGLGGVRIPLPATR